MAIGTAAVEDGFPVWRITESQQEIFDAVCRHLAAQKRPSYVADKTNNTRHCVYRGDTGLRCAIGGIAPDNAYRPNWEGTDVGGLRSCGGLVTPPSRDEQAYSSHISLLKALQLDHDSTTLNHVKDSPTERAAYLRGRLTTTGKLFGLKTDAVKPITKWGM